MSRLTLRADQHLDDRHLTAAAKLRMREELRTREEEEERRNQRFGRRLWKKIRDTLGGWFGSS